MRRDGVVIRFRRSWVVTDTCRELRSGCRKRTDCRDFGHVIQSVGIIEIPQVVVLQRAGAQRRRHSSLFASR